jgi:putative heme-binding domain-containing protein
MVIVMNSVIRLLIFGTMFLYLGPAVMAQRDLKDIPIPDPELERATFQLPEGFEVNLFAADPMIAKPIQMNFDEDGRLWIVSSEVYPQIKPGAAATDRVLVLEDTNQDGVSDRTHVYADGLLIPTGVAPGDGGVYVANSTELLHFADTDGDLKADTKRVVLSGFGTEDTHHILHTLRWGYDGYLYFNQSIYIHSHLETPWGVRRLNAGGIWQYRPETQELGVFMRGLVNTWGHHFDRFGQSFATDGAGGEGINYVIPGACYFTAADASRTLKGLNPGSPKHCGLDLVETPQLPPDWQGSAITNDFRGHRVVRFVLSEEGSGYVSREQQEVIKSDHVAFRPIDVKQGPDGAIYIADWYNPIIQHGEVDFRDDRRDHTHGRIWRVRWTGAKKTGWTAISQLANTDLFETLRSADSFQRQAARQMLRMRGQAIVPELQAWLNRANLTDAEREPVQLEALWCIQASRLTDAVLLKKLLDSKDGRIRAAAVRVLSHWKYEIPQSHEWLTGMVQDVHPRVRLEVIRAMSFSPMEDSQRQRAVNRDESVEQSASHPDGAGLVQKYDAATNIETALKPLKQPMDRFLDYGLWLTTRELSRHWLPAYEKGDVTFADDADQILFAFSAIGTSAPVNLLLDKLYDANIAVDQRSKLVTLIASGADAAQLGRLVNMAAEHNDTAALSLVTKAAAERRIVPVLKGNELDEIVRSDDLLLRQAALKAGGQWNVASLRPVLQATVSSPTADPAERIAAIQGIAAGKSPELLKVLSDLCADRNVDLQLRQVAVRELISCQPTETLPQAIAMLEEFQVADGSAAEIARAYLARKDGSQLLTKALTGKSLNGDVARDLLRAIRESGRPSPELESVIRTAGSITSRKSLTAEQKQALLARAASGVSAAAGEAVYRNEQLGCLKCHAVAGAGGLVGPDMVSLGASAQPDYLLDSLLDPNAKVKENYHTTVVVTTEGKVIAGVQIQKSKTETTLRTADNQVVTIAAADIEESATGVSLMPEALVDTLTDDELASLVRFLSELGRTPEFTVSRKRQVRAWQVMLATPDATHLLRRNSYSIAAGDNPAFQWVPRYSTVSGTLPLADIPIAGVREQQGERVLGSGFARVPLLVTAPGMIHFQLNSVEGLELRIDEKPVNLTSEFSIELPVGPHRLTFSVDHTLRTTPLQLELVDVPSGGNAEFRY